MTPVIRRTEATSAASRIGRPPIPHEHGAWVILYGSMMLGFGAAKRGISLPCLLLLASVTGAFLTREAAALLLRRRGRQGTGFWFGVYLTLFGGGALPLLLVYRITALYWIGALMALLFGLHSALLLRKRLDRSQWGEILGVGALTLTAPAASIVATHRLENSAWLLWGACLLFFSSGIFTVKMYLNAVKARREWCEAKRRELGRDTRCYHLLLAGALLLTALRIGGSASLWLVAAYLPALIRAAHAYARLTPQLPSLKRVGMRETLLAFWFIGCLLAATRM